MPYITLSTPFVEGIIVPISLQKPSLHAFFHFLCYLILHSWGSIGNYLSVYLSAWPPENSMAVVGTRATTPKTVKTYDALRGLGLYEA